MDTTSTVCILLALGLLVVLVLGVGVPSEGFEDWGEVSLYNYGCPTPCKSDEMEFINGNGKKYCKKM
jgi:hypothetical protein